MSVHTPGPPLHTLQPIPEVSVVGPPIAPQT